MARYARDEVASTLNSMTGLFSNLSSMKRQKSLDDLRAKELALKEKQFKQSAEMNELNIKDAKLDIANTERNNRIKAYQGTIIQGLQQHGGDPNYSPTMPEGADAYEWNIAQASAAQNYMNSELGKKTLAELHEADTQKTYEAFKTYQYAIEDAVNTGDRAKLIQAVEASSEIARIPKKLVYNKKTDKFDVMYRHSGSDKWIKTDTVTMEEIVPKLRKISQKQFFLLDAAARRTTATWNQDAWKKTTEHKEGKTQVFEKDGETFLVTPQKDPLNPNKVHYLVTDSKNNKVKYDSRQDLMSAGLRYRDLKEQKAVAERDSERQNTKRLKALTAQAKNKGIDIQARDIEQALYSIEDRTMNDITSFKNGILSDAVQEVRSPMGEDSRGITVFVQDGFDKDFKNAVGPDRRVKKLGNTKEGKVKGTQYLITAKQESIYKLAKAFVSDSKGIIPSSQSFIKSQLKSKTGDKTLTDKEQSTLDNLRKNLKPNEETATVKKPFIRVDTKDPAIQMISKGGKVIGKNWKALDKAAAKFGARTRGELPPNSPSQEELAAAEAKKEDLRNYLQKGNRRISNAKKPVLEDLTEKPIKKPDSKLQIKQSKLNSLPPKDKAKVEDLVVQLSELNDKEKVKNYKALKSKKNLKKFEKLMLMALEQFFTADYKG